MPAWYEAFTAAIADGTATYRRCRDCDASALPPRTICPHCGGRNLEEEPLPDTGTVHSFTEISVTTPKFLGETPYTVVLVDLAEDLQLTAQLRDATSAAIAIGDRVRLGVEDRDGDSDVLIVRPLE